MPDFTVVIEDYPGDSPLSPAPVMPAPNQPSVDTSGVSIEVPTILDFAGPAPPSVNMGTEQADWDSLPDGSFYMDPFGQRRRKTLSSIEPKKIQPQMYDMGIHPEKWEEDKRRHVYERDEQTNKGLTNTETLWDIHAQAQKAKALGQVVREDEGSPGKFWMRNLPVAGHLATQGQMKDQLESARRIQKGDATETDYRNQAYALGQQRRAQEEKKAPLFSSLWWYGMGKMTAGIPGFSAEMALGYGPGTAVAKGISGLAAKRFTTSAIKNLALRKTSELGGKAALFAADYSARAVVLAPIGIPSKFMEKSMTGGKYNASDMKMLDSVMKIKMTPSLEAFTKAAIGHYINVVGEGLGRGIVKLPVLKQFEALKGALIAKLLNKGQTPGQVRKFLSGYFNKAAVDPMLGEVGEELVQQFMSGATGAEDSYGTAGELATDPFGQGAKELLQMIGAFSAFGGGRLAADVALGEDVPDGVDPLGNLRTPDTSISELGNVPAYDPSVAVEDAGDMGPVEAPVGGARPVEAVVEPLVEPPPMQQQGDPGIQMGAVQESPPIQQTEPLERKTGSTIAGSDGNTYQGVEIGDAEKGDARIIYLGNGRFEKATATMDLGEQIDPSTGRMYKEVMWELESGRSVQGHAGENWEVVESQQEGIVPTAGDHVTTSAGTDLDVRTPEEARTEAQIANVQREGQPQGFDEVPIPLSEQVQQEVRPEDPSTKRAEIPRPVIRRTDTSGQYQVELEKGAGPIGFIVKAPGKGKPKWTYAGSDRSYSKLSVAADAMVSDWLDTQESAPQAKPVQRPREALDDYVEATFPYAQKERTENGWDLVTPNGKVNKISFDTPEATPESWDALERQLGRTFSEKYRKNNPMPIRGYAVFSYADGTKADLVTTVFLLRKAAGQDTMDHEAIHLMRAAGMIDDAEWQSLIDTYSSAEKSSAQQEEDIAEAFPTWAAEQRSADGKTSLIEKIKAAITRLLRAMGLKGDIQAESDKIFKRLMSPQTWQGGGKSTTKAKATPKKPVKAKRKVVDKKVQELDDLLTDTVPAPAKKTQAPKKKPVKKPEKVAPKETPKVAEKREPVEAQAEPEERQRKGNRVAQYYVEIKRRYGTRRVLNTDAKRFTSPGYETPYETREEAEAVASRARKSTWKGLSIPGEITVEVQQALKDSATPFGVSPTIETSTGMKETFLGAFDEHAEDVQLDDLNIGDIKFQPDKKQLVRNKIRELMEDWQPASLQDFTSQLAEQLGEEKVAGIAAELESVWNEQPGKKSQATDETARELDDLFDEDTKFQPIQPLWYSKAIREAEALPMKRATPQQVLGWLKKRGVKQTEIDWLGIEAALKGKKSVTKDDVLSLLREGDLEIEEKVLGEPRTDLPDIEYTEDVNARGRKRWRVMGQPQLTIHEVREGPEFREYRITYAGNHQVARDTLAEAKEWIANERRLAEESEAPSTFHSTYTEPGGSDYREVLIKMPEGGFPGVSVHFGGEPNILASVRFNSHRDVDGKKVLFLEEIQSDWHQQGRERGYQGQDKGKDWKAVETEAKLKMAKLSDRLYADIRATEQEIVDAANTESEWNARNYHSQVVKLLQAANGEAEMLPLLMQQSQRAVDAYGDLAGQHDDAKIDLREAQGHLRTAYAGVAYAPFKGTQKWTALAMKRMIRYAADNGFDSIAWTTGKMQNKRYSLSTQIDDIHYWTPDTQTHGNYRVEVTKGGEVQDMEEILDVPEGKLKDYFGTEVAQKIIDGHGEVDAEGTGLEHRVLSNMDLQVGGEAMVSFYEKMLPSTVNKLIKPFGGRVGHKEIASFEGPLTDDFSEAPDTNVPGFDIPSKLRTPMSMPKFQVDKREQILNKLRTLRDKWNPESLEEFTELLTEQIGEKKAGNLQRAIQDVMAERTPDKAPPEESPQSGDLPITGSGGPELVGVYKAIRKELRESVRGLEDLPQSTPQKQADWVDEAMARMAGDPDGIYVERLMRDTAQHPRAWTPVEATAHAIYARKMYDRFSRLSDEQAAAYKAKDDEALANATRELEIVVMELEHMDVAQAAGNSESGRSLRALQLQLARDGSIEYLRKQARVATAGAPLSVEKSKEINDLHEKYTELKKKYDELNSHATDKELMQSVQDEMDAELRDIEKAPKKSRKAKATEKLAKSFKSFASKMGIKFQPIRPTKFQPKSGLATEVVQDAIDAGVVSFEQFMTLADTHLKGKAEEHRSDFQAAWNSLKGKVDAPDLDMEDLATLTKWARRLRRNFMENGMTDRDSLVTAVHESMQELQPELTYWDVVHALGRYGQRKKLSMKEMDVIARDHDAQLRELSKQKDISEGNPPKLTGTIPESPSVDVQNLQKETYDAMRKAGFTHPKDDIHTKSPLATAKTVVLNKIADLAVQIHDGERKVRGTWKVIPDAELTQLEQQLTEERKKFQEAFADEIEAEAEEQKRDTKERQLDRDIKKLSKDLKSGDLAPQRQKQSQIDRQTIQVKQDQLDALRAERSQRRKEGRLGVELAVKALERIEKQEQAVIDSGKVLPKGRFHGPTAPEVFAVQARINELRNIKKSLLESKHPEFVQQQAQWAYEQNLYRQLASWKQRVADAEFEPAPKEHKWKETAQVKKVRHEIADVKEKWGEMLAKYRRENRTRLMWTVDLLKEISGIQWVMQTMWDVGQIGRQGGPIAVASPKVAKEVYPKLYKIYRHWKDSKNIHRDSMEQLQSEPNHAFRVASGVDFTYKGDSWGGGEEGFSATQFAKLLPGAKLSERGFTDFTNWMRARYFDAMVATMGGVDGITTAEAKVYGAWANITGGRGAMFDGPWGRRVSELLSAGNIVAYAARWAVSRVQLLTYPFYLSGRAGIPWKTKRKIWVEFGKIMSGYAMLTGGSFLGLYAAALAMGYDDDELPWVGIDPTSSDFGQVGWGDTRLFDFSFGTRPYVVFAARMWFGKQTGPSGHVTHLRGKKHERGQKNEFDVIGKFLWSKVSPPVTLGIDLTIASRHDPKDRKDIVGEDLNYGRALIKSFSPISTRNMVEEWQALGITGTGTGTINAFGLGGNTYGRRTRYLKMNKIKRTAEFKKYLERMSYKDKKPEYSDLLSVDQMKQVSQRKQEVLENVIARVTQKSLQNPDNEKDKGSAKRAMEAFKAIGLSETQAIDTLQKYFLRPRKDSRGRMVRGKLYQGGRMKKSFIARRRILFDLYSK